MRNTLNPSKTATAMILFLSLLCVQCNKKEEGKLTVTTKPVTEITTESAKCGGDVSSTGNFTIGNCGVCWNTAPSPTIDNFFTTDNQGIGNFVSTMSHLSQGTKYYVRAYATTSSGIMYGEELDFTTEALPVTTLTVYTNDVTEITVSTARCGGVVTANGNTIVTTRGVCWSTSPNPSIENAHTSDGQGIGAFSSIMTQLADSTYYYVRAYATTESGVTYYGEEKSFTTESNGGGGGGNEVTITVYTSEISEITSSTAKCGGVVTANGDVNITARGVCWSTSPVPSLTHHTSDGQGLGSFSSNVTGLDENTSYNIWAYATTSDGITTYGDLKTFNTETASTIVELPTVTIDNVTEITGTSAKCGGTVTSDGGADVTDRGICWSTTQNPMVYHSHVSVGDGTGHFIAEMTGLENGTTYYVKAYATNSEGTNYSFDERTFTTLAPPIVITTSPITNITHNSATVGGNVTDDGGETPVRGICWGQALNPTTNDNHVFCGSGLGEYITQLTGLLPGTTYHIRAFAKNSVATSYGNDVTFTTEATSPSETWLYYDDGIIESTWGYTNGGTLEWAVMFPSNMLEQYVGMSITQVKIYVGVPGTYYTSFYTGSSTPTTQVYSGYSDLDDYGWWTLNLHTPVSITAKNLWVSLCNTHEAGEHPAGCSEGINNPNARWVNWGSHGWCDAYTAGWADEDITWTIRVFVTNDDKSCEIELPIVAVPSYKCEPKKANTSQGIGDRQTNRNRINRN